MIEPSCGQNALAVYFLVEIDDFAFQILPFNAKEEILAHATLDVGRAEERFMVATQALAFLAILAGGEIGLHMMQQTRSGPDFDGSIKRDDPLIGASLGRRAQTDFRSPEPLAMVVPLFCGVSILTALVYRCPSRRTPAFFLATKFATDCIFGFTVIIGLAPLWTQSTPAAYRTRDPLPMRC